MTRTYHRDGRSRKARWAAAALALAAAYGFWRWRPFRVEVTGTSMRPVLEPGDWAIAVRGGGVRRGDVVVLEHPERPGFELVKRVVAVAGERAPNGVVLALGEIWVQGDAPDASTDSRRFGPVPVEHVRAHVRLVWWPLARARRV